MLGMPATPDRSDSLTPSAPNATAEISRGYPLTALQAGMLFHEIHGITGVDIEQMLVRTDESIDVDAFTRAMIALVQRHPVLRTRFVWDTEEDPYQELVDDAVPAVRVSARHNVREHEREDDVRQCLHDDRTEGLTLAVAPPVRAMVLAYGDGDTRLLLSIHHALVDGRCFPILLEDLFAYYDAYVRGEEVDTSPTRLPYREFVEWSVAQDHDTASRQYWTTRLAGFTAPTPLMVDTLPDRGQDPLAWQDDVACTPEETRALETMAQRCGVTVHTIVQAAWSVLLARYSAETDIVFGGTRACRKSAIAGVEDAVGLFINTLPVRASVEPDTPLSTLLHELREQWVAMRAHEHTPLSRVQAWSDVEKGQPLFDSILVFETFDLGERMRALGDAWARRDVSLYERTNFPITVAAYHGTERLRLKIEYDPAKFSAATIRRMLGHLHALLAQFPAAPDAPVRTFALVTPTELQALHATWATPRSFPVPGTLAEWFARQVTQSPDRPAMRFEGRAWSYLELDAAANRVAHALIQQHGIQRGDIVAMCVERSAEIVIGILGILKAGAAYLPIDLAYPAERLQWMLEDAAAPVLLTQAALVHRLPPSVAQVMTFETIAANEALPNTAPLLTTDPDDLAYVIFTSGSTGKPKGCRVTHRNVVRLMTATEPWYQFGAQDVWTLFHSFAFDFSVWEIWGALLYGGCVVVVPYDVTRSPDDFLALLAREQVTVLNQTPSAFRQLIAAEERAGLSARALALRYVIFGGEALELESLRPWFARHGDQHPQLVNMYGITETTVHVTYRPIGQADLASGSVVGRPIPDLEIHLLDPTGHPVPIGVPGEIFVGGAGVTAGYLNRPELTAARFLPHPFREGERLYRTGDVARFLPNADLEYLGRSDDQVKIRGFRIELGEIQAVLLRHPAVREAFVTVLGSGSDKRIVAYLVGDREAGTLTALREFCGAAMPPYMIPAAIVYLDRFPLTNNGKIDRKALPVPDDSTRERSAATYVAPRDGAEALLAQIWARALKLDRVGRDEDFFELGGDSILSIQIVSQARRAGIRLTPRDLFEKRTIQRLVADQDAAAPVDSARLAPIGGPAPLTPIQRWFFAHTLPDPNHWTQAFLLNLARPLESADLQAAFASLCRTHAALRTAFRDGEQRVNDAPAFVYRDVTEAIDDATLETCCLDAQRALRVAEGIMLSVVHFTARQQLYLAIHHLAVDGVSWRILLEDLEALLTGRTPEPVPTPFVNWAHHLRELANEPTIAVQGPWWATQARAFRLVPDGPARTTTVGETRSVTVRLSAAETAALTGQAVPGAKAQLEEVLLASVMGSIADRTGQPDVAIDLESHGRREQSPFDLSRTVGWFTTIYPLAVSLGANMPLRERIERTQRALRAVPERGFAFGLLQLDVPSRDVLFNYLGRFDQVTAESTLFSFASEDSGAWYDAGSSRSHLLEINSWIKEGCLEFTWTFAGVPDALVSDMAHASVEALRAFAAGAPASAGAALLPEVVAPAPSEVALPLTPMQQLYYTLEVARPGAGLDQWHWTLTGRVNADALRQAFDYAAARHESLRTTFHGNGRAAPVQAVRPRVSIPLEVVQVTDVAAFEALLAADRTRALRIDEAPLMRLTLVVQSGGPTRLIWTHHHLQIDGWSWPLLLADVSAAYRAITHGETLTVEPGPAISDYLRWYDAVDLAPSRDFWRSYLHGLREPTPLVSSARARGRIHECTAALDGPVTARLAAMARRLRCPLNAIVQAAWAVVLGERSGRTDVVFGATFAGRPAELDGVESMVGAFVNNLPVRVQLDETQPFDALVTALHTQLVTLAEHQHLPLREIQDATDVPLRAQLFESLLVFQNYTIDERAMTWTDDVRVRDFVAPVRTNYPLTLVVTPDASTLRIDAIHEAGLLADADAASLLDALQRTLIRVADTPTQSVRACRAALTVPRVVPTPAPVRPTAQHPPVTALQRRIASVWERAFGVRDLDIDENFFDLGGHSLLLLRVHGELCRVLDRELSVVEVFGNPTIRKLAAALEPPTTSATPAGTPRATRTRAKTDDIAVIGMSGRFPGAESVAEFWQNLLDNVESIETFSDEALRAEGLDPVAMRAAGHYVLRRGQLRAPELFDAAFFNMSPNEAAATDPQQRLFLETAWSALEDAGYAPSRVSDRVGVFAGMSNNTFYEQYVQADSTLRAQLGDLVVMMGNEKDYLATRTAYKLNLSGPALNVYTACSTSLVAMAEAIYALREGRCELAIAGAVSVTFPQNRGYYHEEGGITSPDGHVRPFDANAAGTVFSNGVAAVVLKPLDQAIADGDTVHAVIKGVGLNNDGSDKVSFTAPSVAGQAGAIREAYAQAGVTPDTIGYVEAHGTATALGDPIEFEALTLAYREQTDRVQAVGLGSVKSNIGHLDAAAGMAGFLKAVLALRDGIIPATLHHTRPHPALRLEQSPFRIIAKNETWHPTDGQPRRAGVSSFGVGGTNAHVLLEQPPTRDPSGPSPRRRELLVLSAKSATALVHMCQALADHLEQHPALPLADVAYTLATGREQFAYRVAVTAASGPEAVAALRAVDSSVAASRVSDLPVAFLFPGQGAQFPGMGRALYDAESTFRAVVDECAALLTPLIGGDLRTFLFDTSDDGAAALNRTRITQPALFVVSYALAKLWQRYGVSPVAMLGHSVGEYSAACLSEALPIDAALRLIATRGRLVDELPGGAMLSIRLPADAVRPLLPDAVEIAAINAPVMTVVAGPASAIAELAARLTSADIAHRDLRTSHAFHSAMMNAVVAPFGAEVASVAFRDPQVPFVSNVTGTWITPDEIRTPSYWAGHIRQTVRFEEGVQCLAADRTLAFVEVGPGRSCVTFAKQSIANGAEYPVVTSLSKDAESESFLDAVGALWRAGGRLDWQRYFAGESRRRIPLPTYPFERKRHWPNARTLVLPLQARQMAAPVYPTGAATAPPALSLVPSSLPAAAASRADRLITEVREQIQRLTGFDDIAVGSTFLDLGLDSLLIGQAATSLSRHFGTRIAFKHLMHDHDTVSKLAAFLDRTLDASKFQPLAAPVAMTASTPAFAAMPLAPVSGDIDARVARLEALLQRLMPGAVPPALPSAPAAPARRGYDAGELHKAGNAPITFGPFRPVATGTNAAQPLTAQQQAHLDALIAAYVARTPKSKANIAQSREKLADPRAGAGFNRLWKEMVYPVVTTGSKGAYLWDLDGNRWIDVTLGFGLGLLGHRPEFVERAVAEQLATGFEIGPSTPLAGEVAALLCEVSGKDRATFCDTGSEAVTAAIRVARTVSQRDKIAVFQGSYHGIFDEVLGRAVVTNGQLMTVPIAPGITEDSLANVLILEYGNPESLRFIERYADELAAVLVEPVQSRRPDLQPREFLQELRALTAAHEIALVFDEVVTGFRCHPQGAQAVFGIDADLVTYGKVMGGGMPIGALAGRKKYMDALDGGAWNYGDDTGPDASVTFFAGTFVRHPLVLAAAKAVMTELKTRGPELQATLDRRTEALVNAMNTIATEAGVPLKVTRFSSMFMLNFAPGLKYASLFFYHMRLRGVHIWETRPSFLSVAHTDEDVAAVLQAFADSIAALQDGGFFPGGGDGDRVAVTAEQEELIVASAMSDAHSRAFNESISIRFDGAVDRRALDTAVRAVVTRHESLRAVFERDGSAQRFVPANRCEITVETVDLRGASDETVRAARDEAITAVFRLYDGPLVRFRLFVLDGDTHELLIVAHHAVCDGWSFGVVYDDVLAHYRQAIGAGNALPAATPFRDFVAHTATPDEAARRDEDTAYWVQQLQPLPPTLVLPPDRRDASGDALACLATTRTLEPALCDAIAAYCKAQRITPYTLFFAAYRDVLVRVSNQEHFCIGTPVASQASAGLPGLVGHGVHFLPLPCKAPGDVSIEAYLAENRTLILESLDHQATTLGRILRALPTGTRLPPVSVTFTLEAMSAAWQHDELRARLQVNAKRYSTFDLSLFVTDDRGRYALLATSARDRFSAAQVDGWLDLLTGWLRAVVHAPVGTPLAALPLVASTVSRNAEVRRYDDVVTVFERQAAATPEAIALRSGETSMRYDALNGLANALAHRLASAGVTPGSCVVLEVDRSIDFVIALLAILKCGAAYVPIDPAYPDAHKQMLREDVSPVLVVDEASLAALRADLTPRADAPSGRREVTADSLAYVMFTSGSTGRPKGVMAPHRGITRLVVDPGCVDITPDDVMLLIAPLSFDASTFELWGALLNGATLVVPPRGALSIRDIATLVGTHAVSVLWLTSGLFHAMIDERLEALTGLRLLMFGGEVASVPHVTRALEGLPGVRVFNAYGPTENTTFTTLHELSRDDLSRATIPIGRPIPGTVVLLLDHERRPVPPGVAGELYTGGAGVALGYLHRPEQTAASFVANPLDDPAAPILYRSGDQCRMLSDGVLEFIGRLDQQVKIRGFRIEPGEVEAVLTAQPGVTGARVLVHTDPVVGKRLVAFCTGDAAVLPALHAVVRNTLAAHMQPAIIRFVPSFPIAPTGKFDNAALLALLTEPGAPSTSALAHAEPAHAMTPATPTEERLHRLWCELLGRDRCSVTDTFFDLGGHSLLGLRLFNRLETEFGFVRPLAVLFQHPTIRTLAAEIDRPATSAAVVSDTQPTSQTAPSAPPADEFLATLRQEGRDAPLFLIHGGDGGIMFYQALVSRLNGVDCPVYAVESPSLTRRDLEVESFEHLVTRYLAIIRAKQPHGPYRIGGYSFGGIVAYELASRLHAEGLPVKLVIFDSANPVVSERYRHSWTRRLAVAWQRFAGDPLLLRLGRMVGRMATRRAEQRTHAVRTAQLAATWRTGTLIKLEDRAFVLNELHQQTLVGYAPRVKLPDALLIKSSAEIEGTDLPDDYGWGAWVEHLHMISVPGNHFEVFAPAAVDTFTPGLQGYLA